MGVDRRLLVVQVAALGWRLLQDNGLRAVAGLEFRPADAVFPALTCPAQASFRTASPPSQHGMISNGLYFRQLHRPLFWEQSADLITGKRIWGGTGVSGMGVPSMSSFTSSAREECEEAHGQDAHAAEETHGRDAHAANRKVAMLFWQQSLGENVDIVLSPAPIHKHHGGMIQDCYCQPPGLYARLCNAVGAKFNLMRYWGPLAGEKVGDWIAAATAALLADRDLAPDLCLTYLPSLDYQLQRWGPGHAKSKLALKRTVSQIELLAGSARKLGYDVLLWGDYAIADVTQAVFPNRALAQAGLLAIREVSGMQYPDLHASRAFAVADHEIANVYVRNPADVARTAEVLHAVPGIDVFDTHQAPPVFNPQSARSSPAAAGNPQLSHPSAGELLAVAQDGFWLAYPWWTDNACAPDYARHVDIHNKPGYDPCELFFGWPPPSTSLDATRIRGSHGKVGPGREIAWAATFEPPTPVTDLVSLAKAAGQFGRGIGTE
jgi:hypothetical protein